MKKLIGAIMLISLTAAADMESIAKFLATGEHTYPQEIKDFMTCQGEVVNTAFAKNSEVLMEQLKGMLFWNADQDLSDEKIAMPLMFGVAAEMLAGMELNDNCQESYNNAKAAGHSDKFLAEATEFSRGLAIFSMILLIK
jgi:hypothetical protein